MITENMIEGLVKESASALLMLNNKNLFHKKGQPEPTDEEFEQYKKCIKFIIERSKEVEEQRQKEKDWFNKIVDMAYYSTMPMYKIFHMVDKTAYTRHDLMNALLKKRGKIMVDVKEIEQTFKPLEEAVRGFTKYMVKRVK
ncbi:hypothetical protein LVT70_01185 [Klebsiella pneumoniae]|nr:hypothetical protein [Klebsiella pneumoniae]